MAEQIADFPVGTSYPWDDWMNGKIWVVRKGSDYQIDSRSFQIYLHRIAHRRKCKVRTNRRNDEITFQFVK